MRDYYTTETPWERRPPAGHAKWDEHLKNYAKHAAAGLAACWMALGASWAWGQQPLPELSAIQPPPARPPSAIRTPESRPAEGPSLTKFNLDFPGGDPKVLVNAIQKATVRPLNVIVPREFGGTEIPALKMNNVLELAHRAGP